MAFNGAGMGQKTGSPVFALRVAISPSLTKFLGKTREQFDDALTPYERIKVEASPDWKIKAAAEDDFVRRTLAKERTLDPELAAYQNLLHG
jgi:hypothetical protein